MSCVRIVLGTQRTLNTVAIIEMCTSMCECICKCVFVCVNCAHMYGCESVCDKGELVYLSLNDLDEWQ